MQSSCLEFEDRRRVQGTRVQSSCLELEDRGLVEGKGCRAVVESKKTEEGLREQEAEQLLRVRREKKS